MLYTPANTGVVRRSLVVDDEFDRRLREPLQSTLLPPIGPSGGGGFYRRWRAIHSGHGTEALRYGGVVLGVNYTPASGARDPTRMVKNGYGKSRLLIRHGNSKVTGRTKPSSCARVDLQQLLTTQCNAD
jgi:hypothetical protein